ncbi:MAG: hypothetical protein WCX73_02625 [Candidatus Pacearchaeota archaeon]|jgi:hypothetical protein
MQKSFVPIHFVSNQGNYEEFKQGLVRYEHLRDLIKTKSNDFNFGLKITTDDKNLTTELRGKTRALINKLPSDLFLLYDPTSRGPGVSSRQVLLNPTFVGTITAEVCLDQQVIDTHEAAERIIDLTSKIEKDNTLYGVGSRTVPVRLSAHPDNNYLRCIQELYFAIAANSKGPSEKLENITPAFAKFGDTSTGMDIVNFAHPEYPKMVNGLLESVQYLDMSNFASNYYIPIRSGELSKITTGYACARENPFTDNIDAKQEFNKITKMVQYITHQLLKTDIGIKLDFALKNKKNLEELSEFYPKQQVEYVRDLMLGNLKV